MHRSESDTITLRRIGVLILAVMQMAAVMAMPVVDSVLETEAFSFETHVESEGTQDCATGHDDLFCKVVSSLSSLVAARAVTSPTDAALGDRLGFVSNVASLDGRFHGLALGARAPPLA